MINLYTWPTPNGHKIHILLEETGLEYSIHPVDIMAGEQFAPDFLEISPNNKIPAIIDDEGPGGEPLSLFDSGAILLYLADKAGRFLPRAPRDHYVTLAWLQFQLGDLGPMLGQAHHFTMYAPEEIPYAIERYRNEANRLYGVMDRRLAGHRYFAGDEYTIADIAIFPWLRSPDKQGVDLSGYPAVARWLDEVAARPAVQRGVAVLADRVKSGTLDSNARENLFGARQYRR